MTKKEKQDAYDRSLARRYSKAKARAKKIGRKFTITFKQFQALLAPNKCTYCGGALEQTGSSLDRVNSKYGYTKSNSTPCCHRCNGMKSAMSVEEFYKHIKKVLEYAKK